MVTSMKILVFSDSHGRLGLMLDAIRAERPRRIFFLGDNYRDGESVADACPDLPVDMVRGNCDFCAGPDELLVEAEGVRFFLTHGHKYQAKSGTELLVKAGRRRGAAVVCFGHTHIPLNAPEGGVWLLNPGTAGGVHNRPGYAVVTVEDGTYRADLKRC